MSDDLAISSGGAIAVDTAELDAAAAELEACGALLMSAAADARRADARAEGVPTAFQVGATGIGVLADALGALGDEAIALAGALRSASAAYALVELRVARDTALAAGETAAARRLDGEIAALERDRPEAADAAGALLDGYRPGLLSAYGRALLLAGGGGPAGVAAGILLLGAATGIRGLGLGTVPAGSRVRAGGEPATLTRLPAAAAAAAPAGLAEAAARIPSSGPARVRIERYERRGGARTFAVYIAGTRSFGGGDPWDMASNVDAYRGGGSDALATVHAALVDAGARPGDELLAFGHSQGGMLAGQLALDDAYETSLVGTFGSPTAVEVGDGTLSVQLRHSDDPVVSLADGGQPQRVGAAGGFVAERQAGAGGPVAEATLSAHHLDRYVETARMVDGSADPRAAALRERLAGLGDATLVEAREYAAERPRAAPSRVFSRGAGGAG